MERALQKGKSFDDELTPLAEKEVTPALMSQNSESDEDEKAEEDEKDEDEGGRRTSQRSSSERRSKS